MIDRVRFFLRRHMWARIIATGLLVASIPLLMVGFLLAVLFCGPYDTIKKWANSSSNSTS